MEAIFVFMTIQMHASNYWIERWDNAGTSVVWVKVPTSGATALTMYYGNPAATSLSNGNTTFDFFDDFTAPP